MGCMPNARVLLVLSQTFDAYCFTMGVYYYSVRGARMAMNNNPTTDRAIITVLGSDRSGIVAAVAGALAEHDANILDISQTILQGIFTMTMLVDLGDADVEFTVLQEQLAALSTDLGVQITMQREEVFNYMYRL